MLFVSEETVRDVLRWPGLIAAMEAALAEFSSGRVAQPVRSILTIEEGRRYFGVMPAAAADVMGVKAVSFYPANAGTALPTHDAAILLFRADSGEPLAALGGRVITEMRTAAVSAAVTRVLMPENSRVLAILGSGVQAAAHLEALRSLQTFDDVRVWSPNSEHALAFARAHDAVATSAREAVAGADVVIVATSSSEPVLHGDWLKEGAHVNAVGACRPTWREMDDATMRNTIVVDSRDAAAAESGDIILSGATIAAEAGELFARAAAIARTETTVFKSLGLAIEDIAAARLVYSLVTAAK